MLTKSAANALLKTLEEPPPGLVFVLATTEPERLPPTILSRCQHFRFRRLTDDQIRSKLTRLVAEAGVESEEPALGLVARAADGGMRDAESLLERLLVSGQPITLAGAEQALGLPPREQLHALATALAADDLAGLLEGAAQLYRAGFAPRTVAEQLARHLQGALHQKLAGTGDEQPLDLEVDPLLVALHALDDEQERFVRNNDLYALEVALIKTRNALVGNVPSSPALEAATAPLSPAAAPLSAAATPPAATRQGSGAGKAAPAFEPNRAPSRPATRAAADTAPAAEPDPGTGQRRSFSWHTVRGKASPQLKAFLMPAAASLEGDVVRLVYQDTHAFHHSQLVARRAELQALLDKELGPGLRLVVDGPGGVRSGGDDPKA